jgi:Ca2+/H+ antiporter
MKSVNEIIPQSKVTVLLAFVPISVVAKFIAMAPGYQFVFSLLAVLALGRNISSTVTGICSRLGPKTAFLFKAIFENAIITLVRPMPEQTIIWN